MFLHHLNRLGQLLAKGIGRDFHRVLEMPHFVFIVVTHINEHGIRIVQHRIHFRSLEIFTDIRRVKLGIVDTVRHDAFTHLHAQHPEGFPVIVQGNVQA